MDVYFILCPESKITEPLMKSNICKHRLNDPHSLRIHLSPFLTVYFGLHIIHTSTNTLWISPDIEEMKFAIVEWSGQVFPLIDLNKMFSAHKISILLEEYIPFEYANRTIFKRTVGLIAFRPVIPNAKINFPFFNYK